MTNILAALKNIVSNSSQIFSYRTNSSNRANSAGECFEMYIKDAFCNSFHISNEDQKNKIFAEKFSYIGNQNNPPDVIIRGGDALEIKKIENANSAIALNSSYPKEKLYANSSMITKSCRDCEDWQEKDILYAIGVVSKANILKSIWFVYGNCYAANQEIYEGIKDKISCGLNELQNIEIAQTNELGRINKVDPLGITYLRIRGMWHIENPSRVFGYLLQNSDNDFAVNCLLPKEKYESFPNSDRISRFLKSKLSPQQSRKIA